MNRRDFLLGSLVGVASAALPSITGAAKVPTDLQAALDFAERPMPTFEGPLLSIHLLPLDGLSEKARRVAETNIHSTLLSIGSKPGAQDEIINVDRDIDAMIDHIGMHGFEGAESCAHCIHRQAQTRHCLPCQYFAKTCELDPDGQPPEHFVRATVQTFGRLVDAGVLDYGVLAAPSWLELQPHCGSCRIGEVHTCQVKNTAALFFYAFPSLRFVEQYRQADDLDVYKEMRHRLNSYLGNRAFQLEGEFGNDDWSSLICGECGRPTIGQVWCGSHIASKTPIEVGETEGCLRINYPFIQHNNPGLDIGTEGRFEYYSDVVRLVPA